MTARIRSKLTYSNVISSIALFAALTGVAVAAGVPKNSVGTNQLKNGAVSTKKLHREAVTNHKLSAGAITQGKVAGGAITNSKLANGAVTSSKLGNGSVGSSKLGANSVSANAIKNGVVNSSKLAGSAVTTNTIKNGAVTAAKLDPGLLSQEGNLAAGQTLRGVFALGGDVNSALTSETFHVPLANAPAFQNNVLKQGETNGACPSSGGGTKPQAAPGQLCLYITESGNMKAVVFADGSVNRLGFGLFASFTEPNLGNNVEGVWAVTAP
jgi:hypothetical protein